MRGSAVEVPLKTVVGINERALPDSTPEDRTFRYVDISSVGHGALSEEPQEMRFGDAPSRARRLVRPGDTLVSTVRTYLRAVWPVAASDDPASLVASTGFAVLSPRPPLNPRFFGWYAQSEPFIERVVARSVGVSYPAINASDLGRFLVPLPSPSEQRAIADYLDAETARIDALITKKRRLIELLNERREGLVEEAVRALARECRERPLCFAAPEVLVGIVVTPAAFYADEGVLALRGVNIRPGRIDLTDTVNLSQEGHALHMKSRLAAGDVVVVRTGQAGAAAVVPPDMDGVNCIDLLIVRRSPILHSAYLEFVLNSDWTRKHIEEHSVGTIQSHFNVGALKRLPVPVPPLDVQRKVAERLTTVVGRIDRAASRLSEQIDLLSERRQALITAAVSGELEVPGVAA